MSHVKRLKKTIIYRLVSFSIASVICYFFTGAIVSSLGLAASIELASTIAYYIFETYWDGVHNGEENGKIPPITKLGVIREPK